MSDLLQRPEELDAVVERATPRRVALMLYGSVARGTATSGSDIDILELVAAPPHAYSVGRCNVTQYTPGHLEMLAANGSLFVRHLHAEGRILSDQSGRLGALLASYHPPASYANLLRQIQVAGGALDPQATDLKRWTGGLARLGLYLLRTSVYISRAQDGSANFDLTVGLDKSLARLFELRHQTHFTADDVAQLHAALVRLDPHTERNRFGTVEAYAVAHSTRQDLAGLFAPVLGGTGSIDYGTLSLPPF